MKRVACVFAVVAMTSGISAAEAQEMPAAYAQVLTTLGKTGDFKDNVLKVNIPRNDVKVVVGWHRDADAVRFRRVGGLHERHRW